MSIFIDYRVTSVLLETFEGIYKKLTFLILWANITTKFAHTHMIISILDLSFLQTIKEPLNFVSTFSYKFFTVILLFESTNKK